MPIKLAINGYGRIGRNVLRAVYETDRTNEIQIVAINDLADAETNALLTQRDTAHGKFPGEVSVEGENMIVNGDKIRVLAERDPAKLPWGEMGVDVVLECTGLVRQQRQGGSAPEGRRPQGADLRPGRQGPADHRLWRQPRHPHGRRRRRLQRLVHHQLPGPAGQAAARSRRCGIRA